MEPGLTNINPCKEHIKRTSTEGGWIRVERQSTKQNIITRAGDYNKSPNKTNKNKNIEKKTQNNKKSQNKVRLRMAKGGHWTAEANLYGGQGGPGPPTHKIFPKKNLNFTLNFVYFFSFTPQIFFLTIWPPIFTRPGPPLLDGM
jgi:hypothetical protein